MRIAYVANETSPNGFYRGHAPMTALAHWRGHRVQRIGDDESRWPAGCDVLHIHRHTDERMQLLARQAKAEGAAVVCGCSASPTS